MDVRLMSQRFSRWEKFFEIYSGMPVIVIGRNEKTGDMIVMTCGDVSDEELAELLEEATAVVDDGDAQRLVEE